MCFTLGRWQSVTDLAQFSCFPYPKYMRCMICVTFIESCVVISTQKSFGIQTHELQKHRNSVYRTSYNTNTFTCHQILYLRLYLHNIYSELSDDLILSHTNYTIQYLPTVQFINNQLFASGRLSSHSSTKQQRERAQARSARAKRAPTFLRS